MGIIPIRCFSCNKVIAHLWEVWQKYLDDDVAPADALDRLGLVRYCCRRMILTHVDLINDLLLFNPMDKSANIE